MDQSYYVAFSIGGQDLGLDPNGHSKGMTGPVVFWHVDDIRAKVKELLDGSAEEHQAIQDVGGGNLIVSVKDADGNVIGLYQAA